MTGARDGILAAMLTILLHRRCAERHALALRIDEGSATLVDLETRSYLVHDLVHWCAEAELALDEGFWGLLARGVPLDVLNDRASPPSRFAVLTSVERLVGPLQSFLQGRFRRELLFDALPPSFTPAHLEGVERRFRTALGAWKATPFGSALRFTWPESPPVVVR